MFITFSFNNFCYFSNYISNLIDHASIFIITHLHFASDSHFARTLATATLVFFSTQLSITPILIHFLKLEAALGRLLKRGSLFLL